MNARDVDYTMQGIRQDMREFSHTLDKALTLVLMGTRATGKLLQFLMRLAKEGLISKGILSGATEFIKDTQGEYQIYNIPLSEESLKKIEELENRINQTTVPALRESYQKELDNVWKTLPEAKKLSNLGIHYCNLPNVDGDRTKVQVMVDNKDLPLFKTFFDAHVMNELSGGLIDRETLKQFTENEVSIVPLPFEEPSQLGKAYSDFNTLGINFSPLPDLYVGDGYTQVIVPNKDVPLYNQWIGMYKNRLLKDANTNEAKREVESSVDKLIEAGEDKSLDGYRETATIDAEKYMNSAKGVVKEANEKYETSEKGFELNTVSTIKDNNSIEYYEMTKNKEYKEITISVDQYIDSSSHSIKSTQAIVDSKLPGNTVFELPGSYKDGASNFVICPNEQIFKTENGENYKIFLPKDGNLFVTESNKYDIHLMKFDQKIQKQVDKATSGLSALEKFDKKFGKDLESAKEFGKEVAKEVVPLKP